MGADKNRDEGKNTWWFASPTDFVGGDAALVYNSWLTYTLGHFEYEDLGQGVMEGYDVMLISTRKKFSIGLKGVFSPPEDSLAASYEVRMDETFTPNNGTSYWELVTGKVAGKRVTKHDFVQCLVGLRKAHREVQRDGSVVHAKAKALAQHVQGCRRHERAVDVPDCSPGLCSPCSSQ